MTYRIPAGSLIATPDVMPTLHALLRDGRRAAARNGWSLGGSVATWLSELDAVVSESARSQSPTEVRPVRWLSTADAATRLEVSTRALRALGDRKRWQSRRRPGVGGREWLESDVDAEVWARAEDERHTAARTGTPSETDST